MLSKCYYLYICVFICLSITVLHRCKGCNSCQQMMVMFIDTHFFNIVDIVNCAYSYFTIRHGVTTYVILLNSCALALFWSFCNVPAIYQYGLFIILLQALWIFLHFYSDYSVYMHLSTYVVILNILIFILLHLCVLLC